MRLFEELRERELRIVFAESCTGGMMAAAMTRLPGASDLLCGSWVVYRDDSKIRWLGLNRSWLERHGAVSQATSDLLARNALSRTREAELAIAITGNLAPTSSPDGTEGQIYISIDSRRSGRSRLKKRLRRGDRAEQQLLAAARALEFAGTFIGKNIRRPAK